MKIVPAGPWNPTQIDRYLRETVAPIRLACIGGRGWPLVLSLWFEYDEGVLWCATHSRSRLAGHLKHDGRVAFEVSPNQPPYRGVRGRGRATLDAARGEAVLRGSSVATSGTRTPTSPAGCSRARTRSWP